MHILIITTKSPDLPFIIKIMHFVIFVAATLISSIPVICFNTAINTIAYVKIGLNKGYRNTTDTASYKFLS